MPQLSPMLWVILYSFFWLLFLSFCVIIWWSLSNKYNFY